MLEWWAGFLWLTMHVTAVHVILCNIYAIMAATSAVTVIAALLHHRLPWWQLHQLMYSEANDADALREHSVQT